MGTADKELENYYDSLPDDRKEIMFELRQVISKNLPKGFTEVINYKMPSWVVPHSIYPKGYHCDTKLPLPFLSLASQKNFIALYHMGIYADPALLKWFTDEYPKHAKSKLDMGKSCIRFKKTADIPLQLIGELCKKMRPKDWIARYESAFLKN
jgi:hypothetical protein